MINILLVTLYETHNVYLSLLAYTCTIHTYIYFQIYLQKYLHIFTIIRDILRSTYMNSYLCSEKILTSVPSWHSVVMVVISKYVQCIQFIYVGVHTSKGLSEDTILNVQLDSLTTIQNILSVRTFYINKLMNKHY